MVVFPLFKRTNSASVVPGNFWAIFHKLSPDFTTYLIFCGADWGAAGLGAAGLGTAGWSVVAGEADVVWVEPTDAVEVLEVWEVPELLEPSVPTTEAGATNAVSTGAAATTGFTSDQSNRASKSLIWDHPG
jgi:hypothetical protein